MLRFAYFEKYSYRIFSGCREPRKKYTRAIHNLWREGNVVMSPHKTVEIPDSTLAQHVWANLDRWPQRTALVCGITCRQYTYEQAYQMSRNFAANLRKKFRLRDDDTVALVLPNLPEYPIALLGASEAGCVVTTVNPMYTAHEVQHSFKISNPKLVVTTADNFNVVKKAMEMNKSNAPIITIKQSNESPPRGAASFRGVGKRQQRGQEYSQRSQEDFGRLLFLGTDSKARPHHFEHLHRVVCGAAPLPLADLTKLFEKANRELNFAQGYGMTETSPLATLMFFGSKNYASAGPALPNVELKIIDSELRALGPNEAERRPDLASLRGCSSITVPVQRVRPLANLLMDKTGELLIRGPNVMKGYKNNPESNREAFVDGRWLKTGDLATINEDGEVTITDRLKELIKVKGFQVAPAELEAVLKEYPEILDAAVVGVKDDVFGEIPKAFVVSRNNKILDSNKILDFVAKKVAPYKRIKEIVYIDRIPKSPSGKILRSAILTGEEISGRFLAAVTEEKVLAVNNVRLDRGMCTHFYTSISV
ncbi:4-coumarate--CoA ligase-like 5 [Eumeta japonica]|uniref:4-coumarate--CoA ligase-like 5 n=1 Tax=Eumeta variegata TaxID=151549 RepID=A0A4C1TLI2_EUMVA|nr:4-coumarate--CoA ligase-like 5 [Eumeta japonica]